MWFWRKKKNKPPVAPDQGGQGHRPSQTSEWVRVRVPTDLLALGMRVVDLDRPWTEVPTRFQDMVIEYPEDIDTLRHHCKFVEVELDRALYDQLKPHLETVAVTQERLHETRTLAEEMPRAREVWNATQSYVDSVLEAIERGDTLPIAEARPLVQQCIRSISANPNAMFWMSRIKSEDAYTAEHCLRVGIYAITLGRYLGLPEKDLETVGLCGLLHDIGKMRVDPAVLNKPGPLTAEEMKHMQRHPELGYELLHSEHTVEPIVLDAALHHHERMNGRGYPHRLQGDQISRYSRLVAIVDVFDAMTSDRCYRAGMSTADALRILYQGRGEQYDVQMIESFIRMIGLYPSGTLVELTNGEVALVIGTHPDQKLRPRVEILLDADKQPCAPRILDLSRDHQTESGALSVRSSLPDGTYGITVAARVEQLAGSKEAAMTKPIG